MTADALNTLTPADLMDFKVGAASLRRIQRLEGDLKAVGERRSWNPLVKILRAAIGYEARQFLLRFRASFGRKFKVQTGALPGAFKSYSTGNQISNVKAGVFTRWKAAKLYETGGILRDPMGGSMAFPINRKAFTANGRVKKKWRDPRNFPGLVMIVTKRAVMLVQPIKVIKNERAAKRYGGALAVGAHRAFEIMFMLIRSSRRRAVLSFFADFAAMAATSGYRLEQAIGGAVQQLGEEGLKSLEAYNASLGSGGSGGKGAAP